MLFSDYLFSFPRPGETDGPQAELIFSLGPAGSAQSHSSASPRPLRFSSSNFTRLRTRAFLNIFLFELSVNLVVPFQGVIFAPFLYALRQILLFFRRFVAVRRFYMASDSEVQRARRIRTISP